MKVINDLQAMQDLVYPPLASIGFAPPWAICMKGI
jgi:hypothetical protein